MAILQRDLDRPQFSTDEVLRISEQLERLLISRQFKNGRRCPAFLRFIVESSLRDAEVDLKERILGVDIFGRSPDYDTALDPIVRIIAGETRKRIAQYYEQAEHQNELKISLPLGTYKPVFDLSFNESKTLLTLQQNVEQEDVPLSLVGARRAWPRPDRLWIGLLPLILISVIFIFVTRWKRPQNAEDRFWAPFIAHREGILIGIGRSDPSGTSLPLNPDVIDQESLTSAKKAFVVSTISAYLAKRGKFIEVRDTREITQYDFQGEPVILIGEINSSSIRGVLSQLPIRANTSVPGLTSLVEASDQTAHRWEVNTDVPSTQIPVDYGIVARMWNSHTGQFVVVVTGVTDRGLCAVARIFSHPELFESAHVDFSKPNIELLVATSVVDGLGSRPRIETSRSW